MSFTYATVCSGIEACSVALDFAPPTSGCWRPVFFSEIAKFPCRLLKSRYPDVPNLGDITNITYRNGVISNGSTDIRFHGRLDLLAGGTPCQDFSNAGLRAGGAKGSGTRSSLCWEFLRLASEFRPRVVLWENVVGCLSANGGRDFYTFVQALQELGFCVSWRVLDSRHTRVDGWPMAIPQRRRRVWLVGCLESNPKRAAQILFEPKSMLGDTPKECEAWASVASGTATCSGNADAFAVTEGLNYGNVYPTLANRVLRETNHGTSSVGNASHHMDAVPVLLRAYNFELTTNGVQMSARRAKDNLVYGVIRMTSDRTVSGKKIPVRRIMPEECERLMGFPEGYTNIPYRASKRAVSENSTTGSMTCPDSPRYVAIGNSWAINSARWVLLGIHRYLENLEEEKENARKRN